MAATAKKSSAELKEFRFWKNNNVSEEQLLSIEETARKFRSSGFFLIYKAGSNFDRAALHFLSSSEEEGGLSGVVERNDTQPFLNALYREVARLEVLEDKRTISRKSAGSAYTDWCYCFRKINGKSPATTLLQFCSLIKQKGAVKIGAVTIIVEP